MKTSDKCVISKRGSWSRLLRSWPVLIPRQSKKYFHNIRRAEQTKDPKLFKKLKDDIWEFRVRYGSMQIRLLAFWDKSENGNTLVVATHGFVKKVDKVPENEIERAKNLRNKYFESLM